MRTFYLKYKNFENDIIMRIDANSLDQAISFFSKVKKLEKDDLLKVFIVTDQVS
jgi:hypothetical protein